MIVCVVVGISVGVSRAYVHSPLEWQETCWGRMPVCSPSFLPPGRNGTGTYAHTHTDHTSHPRTHPTHTQTHPPTHPPTHPHIYTHIHTQTHTLLHPRARLWDVPWEVMESIIRHLSRVQYGPKRVVAKELVRMQADREEERGSGETA